MRLVWNRLVGLLFSMDRRTSALVCGAMFLATAVADVLTPPYLNLSFAYILTILLATWNGGVRAGVVLAVLAAAMQAYGLSTLPPGPARDYALFSFVNRAFSFFIIVALAAPLRALFDRERLLARSDPLTGAPNRKAFENALAREIARSRRGGAPFTVAFLDCDRFKEVNDRHGHAAGDEVLRSVVRSGERALRVNDMLARIGGDEFGILFPHAGGAEALRALERLRAAFERAQEDRGWQVSLSIGAITFLKPDKTPAEILAACDALMYRAKEGGAGRIVFEDAR